MVFVVDNNSRRSTSLTDSLLSILFFLFLYEPEREDGLLILTSFCSCPSIPVIKDLLASVERVTFYGFLMALSKHGGVNESIGRYRQDENTKFDRNGFLPIGVNWCQV